VGQALLADALRIDPSAPVAQMAFERMQGLSGDHGELEEYIRQFDLERLNKLEAEMRRPSFRRAQMGFNNNIKFRDTVFHVQTEDSGLDAPHVITHLFADGGRVIKSHKRSYEEHVDRPDVAEYVRSLMKAQHLEMVMKLRDGSFDRILAGAELGGIETLTEPPNVDILKLKKKKEAETAETAPAPPVAEVGAEAVAAARAPFRLHVLRSLSGGPESYLPVGARAVLPSRGGDPHVA
jgi:hypothetical protein